MAKALNEEITTNIKELIAKITHYEVGSDAFNAVEKRVVTTLKKSDTMYFLTTKDIKTGIWSMGEKFMFHGFFTHADYLKKCHDKYIDGHLSESDLTPRLNIVKFLLCMSENPTSYFWRYPDQFEFIYEQKPEKEVVDWGAYLNEGIERWSPVIDESFDLSDSDDEISVRPTPEIQSCSRRAVIAESCSFEEYDLRASRSLLLDSVQSDWFKGKVTCTKPSSEWFDASVGILWQQHLQNLVRDLIQIDPITVISEYKAIREVLWQMWGPHNSTIFEVSVSGLVPRANVTISSVCSMTFEKFMGVFVPYIELLDEFRLFHLELETPGVPETYKSYGYALRKITTPVFDKLIEIESEVREQDSTMTLLKLAGQLEIIFEPIKILKNIHEEVVIDFKENSSLECALTLLTRLRKGLQFSLNKTEQDIRLSLYLESLYYYFTIINAWLVKNDLSDYTEEFIILNKNAKNRNTTFDNFDMNFVPQENIKEFSDDDIVQLIRDQVLQIGRNIHLLRLLGKYDVFAKGSETIHQEFIRRILAELSNFCGREKSTPEAKDRKLQKVESNFDIYEMGDWTTFVDLSDGCLNKAFDGFYLEEVEESSEMVLTLFEKISRSTKSLFPLQGLPERVFGQILRDRFTISGLMVKNLLIENYNLDKQFEFLNHLFLFNDDFIFPFYRRLFEKMNTANNNWGNSVWLTSHLQDVIMDLYPNFYEDCSVQVENHWKQCRDSLEACTLLCLQYEIKWPLSIIITGRQLQIYRELFQFILKLKWALYTVNHLSFSDLEPKKSKISDKHPYQEAIKRLKYLRFNLINILNTIQHYLFGFVFNKYRIQFELDFERSNDLKSLITSHEDFIKSIHQSIAEIRDKKRNNHGFNTLLKCVKMLKVMWNKTECASSDNLDNCHRTCETSFDVINSIVNPVYVFNY